MGDLREKLARLCQDQWSAWMHYLFSKGIFNADGTWTMPAWAVERWQRQMAASFEDLPEDEKETDRREADKYLGIIEEYADRARWLLRQEEAEQLLRSWIASVNAQDRDEIIAHLVEDTRRFLAGKTS